MSRRLGCGTLWLAALITIHHVTRSVIGTAIVTATVGVQQGSPTSCILSFLFIDDLIKLLRESCKWEGFLSWLHALVLMNDIVLLTRSRERMAYKMSLLSRFCNTHVMIISMIGIMVKWCERCVFGQYHH